MGDALKKWCGRAVHAGRVVYEGCWPDKTHEQIWIEAEKAFEEARGERS